MRARQCGEARCSSRPAFRKMRVQAATRTFTDISARPLYRSQGTEGRNLPPADQGNLKSGDQKNPGRDQGIGRFAWRRASPEFGRHRLSRPGATSAARRRCWDACSNRYRLKRPFADQIARYERKLSTGVIPFVAGLP
jgi:hypothetical protein